MDLYIEHYLDLHNYINDKICKVGYDGELFVEKKKFNLFTFILKGIGIAAIVALFLKLYNFISKQLNLKSNKLQKFCDDLLNGIFKKPSNSKDNSNEKSNKQSKGNSKNNSKDNSKDKEPELTEQQILKIKDNIIKIKDNFSDFISQYYCHSSKFNKSLAIFNIEFFCLYNLKKKNESEVGPSNLMNTLDYLEKNKDNFLKVFLEERKKFEFKPEKVILFEYIYNDVYRDINRLTINDPLNETKRCIDKIKLMLRCTNNFVNALAWKFVAIVGQLPIITPKEGKYFARYTLETCFMDYYRNSNMEKLLEYLIDHSHDKIKELTSPYRQFYYNYDRNKAENLLNEFVEKTKKANLDQELENHLFLNFRNYIKLLKEYVNFEVKIINYADQMLKI